MRLDSLLSGFRPPTQFTCAGEEAFYRWRSGEITQAEYHVENARLVAENYRLYREPVYAPPMPLLKRYIDERLSGVRSDRDPVLACKNGEWLFTLLHQRNLGEGNRDLFLWSAEQLRTKGLEDLAQVCDRETMRIEATPFPQDGIRALRTQEMDADAKRGNL